MIRKLLVLPLLLAGLCLSLLGTPVGASVTPRMLSAHAPGNPNTDCDVIYVHMKKVQQHLDKTVHRESSAKVVCDAFRLPMEYHATIGIDKWNRRTLVWEVVGTGPRHDFPPIHDHVYVLDMPCVPGKYRGDLHLWGVSSDDVPQNSHYYSTHGGVKPLRIANCKYTPPGGR